MMLGIIPVKISSKRLMLKNLYPIEGIPSFVRVALTMANMVDEVVVSVESGGLTYVSAIASPYVSDTNIDIIEAGEGVHSTVDSVVEDVIRRKGGNDFVVCYATLFNVTERHIMGLMSERIHAMAAPVGYVDRSGKPIGLSSFNRSQFRIGGHYPDEYKAILSDMVDIDTKDDLNRSIEQRINYFGTIR